MPDVPPPPHAVTAAAAPAKQMERRKNKIDRLLSMQSSKRSPQRTRKTRPPLGGSHKVDRVGARGAENALALLPGCKWPCRAFYSANCLLLGFTQIEQLALPCSLLKASSDSIVLVC